MVSENKNIEKENIEDLYHNLKIGLEDVVNGIHVLSLSLFLK